MEEEREEERIETSPLELSEEQKASLLKDTKLVTEFWRNKYEKNAGEPLVIFEVGCGVGNAFFPLLVDLPNLQVNACDLSPRAINLIKENPQYDSNRCNVFVCDITQQDITDNVTSCSVDCATMIFVLSAIHPDKMANAIENVVKTVRPGGMILVRDYGVNDNAMLRFKPGHKLSERFYVRQDGTRAYYFETEELSKIFAAASCETVECSYVHRRTTNKKECIDVPRIFVQGKFRKPLA